ncbi:unannotated protein [freshwater metagenome]|uniref:Unannotated protein n=1 Tax=freshwater metagenome TaxID=449393 RepID=A0A6J6HLC4_9ZZZZ
MSGHGTGIPQAQVDVIQAVSVGEVRALGAGHKQGEGPSPPGHPDHRHPAVEAGKSSLVEGLGGRVGLNEALLFPCHQTGKVVLINGAWHGLLLVDRWISRVLSLGRKR